MRVATRALSAARGSDVPSLLAVCEAPSATQNLLFIPGVASVTSSLSSRPWNSSDRHHATPPPPSSLAKLWPALSIVLGLCSLSIDSRDFKRMESPLKNLSICSLLTNCGVWGYSRPRDVEAVSMMDVKEDVSVANEIQELLQETRKEEKM
ncbi:hypothetical protein CJ030_MR1G023288 [Morella rubra]|uniref:Uncharacterized protein n=1 Tax=Morella rubra TaxID=262757 RepID=A0A6A1WR82_9ROSI|nr:hypothetical protein CJ030_MR1G023288 [Morella rubra]